MVLSVYQVNNVLRVYKDQLRHGRSMNRGGADARPQPDKISISGEAKRKIIADRIAADIASRIAQNGPKDTLETEVFQKLEDACGSQLEISGKGTNDLIFTSIDDNGETIKSISVEDSEILAHKLHDIVRETVEHYESDTLESM